MYKFFLLLLAAGVSQAATHAHCVFEGEGNGEVFGEIFLDHDGKETE